MAELNVKVKKATESITRWFGATGIVSQPFPLYMSYVNVSIPDLQGYSTTGLPIVIHFFIVIATPISITSYFFLQ